MSLKKCNKKVIMMENDKKRLLDGIKTKENDLISYCEKNKINKFQITKKSKKKKYYFVVRGSFDKHLFSKTTKDCDVHLFIKNDFFKNDDELEEFHKVQKWKDKIKDILEKAWQEQYFKNTTTKPSIDFTIYLTEGENERILSIIPVLIYKRNYQYPKLNQKNQSIEWINSPKWDTISQFNQYVKKYKRRRRTSIRRVIKISKHLLKPHFQKLSTTVLEYYILDRFFKNKNKLPNDYLKLFIDLFKKINQNDLKKYIEENLQVFERFNYLNSDNSQTWTDIKNYANSTKINDWSKLEQLIDSTQ